MYNLYMGNPTELYSIYKHVIMRVHANCYVCHTRIIIFIVEAGYTRAHAHISTPH